MAKYPGFLLSLQTDLESLPQDILTRVSRHGGLEISDMMSSILRPLDHEVCDPSSAVDVLSACNLNDADLGKEFLRSQRIAVIVYGRNAIESAKTINEVNVQHAMSLSDDPMATLHPFETPLLTPQHRLEYPVELVSCGTGDVIEILKENDLLSSLRQKGIEHLYLTDLNTINYRLVGLHVRLNNPLTCQVERTRSESDVLLVNHQGSIQLASKFRINLSDPIEDPVNKIDWAWTGTAIIDLKMDISSIVWRWHRRPVIKNGRVSYQFMRSFEDVTSTFKTEYVQ